MKYLNVVALNKVRDEVEEFRKTKVIEIDTHLATNMILAEDICSNINTPNFNKSSVDGYAINHLDSASASESSPTMLSKIPSYKIGEENKASLNNGQCQYVVTGGMLPSNCSGVVKVEECEEFGNNVLVKTMISKNDGMVLIGEEFKIGDFALNCNKNLTNRDIALLLSLGVKKIKVFCKITCVVVSSGNELVDYKNDLSIGKIYDINTYLVSSELVKLGIDVVDTLVIKDDYDLYLKTLKSYDVDLYITSGGSSKGNEDYTLSVFEELTNNIICHGISTKPGKPTILAKTDEKLYLGLPGNPVSAFMILHQLFSSKKKIKIKVSENVNSDHGKTTAVLVKVIDNQAVPIYYRSSYLNSLSEADGYFVICENLEGVNQGDEMEVVLFE